MPDCCARRGSRSSNTHWPRHWPDRPLLLFQHHPPFDIGLRYMDGIKLANPEAEWDVIARTRKPDYLFMGHLHRPISGIWRGIPFHIQRALSHQVAFDLETADHIPGSPEPPDYSHVTVGAGRVVIHQCSFLYEGPLFLVAGPRRAGVDQPISPNAAQRPRALRARANRG